MDYLQAILLGALQGATEFLPISSSGHLKLGNAMLGVEEPELLFDIILHVGSLVAVCLVYRREIWSVITGLFHGLRALFQGKGIAGLLAPEGARLSLLVVLATLPTGVIGVLLEKLIVGPLGSVAAVGVFLLLNSLVLLSSRMIKPFRTVVPEDEDTSKGHLWGLTPGVAILIGVIQGIAVFPGLSRSGLTITACLLLGVQRENAARFSFLLSIPAILGALVLKLDPALWQEADPERLTRYGLGAAAAAIVGYLCLIFLLRLLRQARFYHFAWYCMIAGALALFLGLR